MSKIILLKIVLIFAILGIFYSLIKFSKKFEGKYFLWTVEALFVLSSGFLIFQYFNSWDPEYSQSKAIEEKVEDKGNNDKITKLFLYSLFRALIYFFLGKFFCKKI